MNYNASNFICDFDSNQLFRLFRKNLDELKILLIFSAIINIYLAMVLFLCKICNRSRNYTINNENKKMSSELFLKMLSEKQAISENENISDQSRTFTSDTYSKKFYLISYMRHNWFGNSLFNDNSYFLICILRFIST